MGRGLGKGRLGRMPLGGEDISLAQVIGDPVSWIFRSAGVMFRDRTTGRYTGEWVDISQYVKKWGTMELAIDDTRFNNFQDRGVTVTVNNDAGTFNPKDNPTSIWYGTLNRYRTLLRIQAGYYMTDLSTTLPGDTTLGIFILDQEIAIETGSNDVLLRASSLKNVFTEVLASEIGGIFNATMTADQVVAKIRDHTDGAGAFVFREFITSTMWSITAGVNNYVLTTDLANEMNVWDVMNLLAESEGYVLMISRLGGVAFRPRTARQATSQFSLYGQGFPRPNIINITNAREARDKYYNYFSMKYLEADTATSFVNAGVSTIVDNSNASWLNGAKQYNFENLFPSGTATAQAIVDSLFSSASDSVPFDMDIETFFIPGLEVLDSVDVSYRSYDMAGATLWDTFLWDNANWSSLEGTNFDLNSQSSFLLSVRIDLDQLRNQFTVREA